MKKIRLEYGDKHLQFDFPYKYKLLETNSTGRGVIDWQKKRNKVIKPMQKMIIKKLAQYKQFKTKTNQLTTKIMKLTHNIF